MGQMSWAGNLLLIASPCLGWQGLMVVLATGGGHPRGELLSKPGQRAHWQWIQPDIYVKTPLICFNNYYFLEKECKKINHVLTSWQTRKRGNEKCPEMQSRSHKRGV